METQTTGILEFVTNAPWAAVRLHYTETCDPDANTSDLTVTGIQVRSGSWYGVTYYIDGIVCIAGQTVARFNSENGEAMVTVGSQDGWYPIVWAADGSPVTGSLTRIPHTHTGQGQTQISLLGNRFARFAFYTVSGGAGSGWGVSDTQTLELTDIPRANGVAATDGAIGGVSTVTVTRRSESYAHSISYRFGQLTGWLDDSGATVDREQIFTAAVVPFALPETFYTQLTDAAQGLCQLTCTTYLDGVPVGQSQQTTFRVTAEAARCAPLVTGSVTDSNPITVALTGDDQVLIRYASTALCTVRAQGQHGAAITQITVDGQPVEGDSLAISQVQTGRILFSATDSRGFTALQTVEAPLIPYVPLTLKATAKRTDPTGGQVILTLRGNYYGGSFGTAENRLTLSCRVGEETVFLEPSFEGDTYTAQVTLSGFDYRSSHYIAVEARDAIATLADEALVGKGIPVFDWGEGDFTFHVPVALEAGATFGGKALWELVYPVGSLYAAADATDPAQRFGGVWTPVENTMNICLWQRLI